MPHVKLITFRGMIINCNPLIFIPIRSNSSLIHQCGQSWITLSQIQTIKSNFFHIIFDIHLRSRFSLRLPIIRTSQLDSHVIHSFIGLDLLGHHFRILIQTIIIIPAQTDSMWSTSQSQRIGKSPFTNTRCTPIYTANQQSLSNNLWFQILRESPILVFIGKFNLDGTTFTIHLGHKTFYLLEFG